MATEKQIEAAAKEMEAERQRLILLTLKEPCK